ncbi:MAG TPA: hypothetical protein VLU24_01290, partial [Mycobacterium sp.]|nr:hypothetical protein [Mycobacterium sp.]
AAMSGAGTASATCASISGIGNSAECNSTPTSFAVGIGPNTFASANGLFTGAIAVGLNNGAADSTFAYSEGAFSYALASGKNTEADAIGNLALAAAIGDNLYAQAGDSPGDNLNVALNLAPGETGGPFGIDNSVYAMGQGNLAVNLGGTSSATRINLEQAFGSFNTAFNLGGKGNSVSAGNAFFDDVPAGPSTGGVAFNAFGDDNDVTAIGPGAFAGTLGVSNLNAAGGNAVNQVGFGFNVKTPLNP